MTRKQMNCLEELADYAIAQKLNPKEIVPFEDKYLNIAKNISTYNNLPTDIIICIILYTDAIAPCRVQLLCSILKQNVQ